MCNQLSSDLNPLLLFTTSVEQMSYYEAQNNQSLFRFKKILLQLIWTEGLIRIAFYSVRTINLDHYIFT